MHSATTKSDKLFDGPLEKLRQELDCVFDAFRTQGEKAFDAFGFRGGNRPWTPDVDVTESDDSVLVECDLPGVEGQTVEILLVGNMLTLKGQRSARALRPQDVAHKQECSHGQFSRSIPLPAAVDPDQVHAEAKNGVLTVTLAKRESAKARQIHVEIRHGDESVT